MLILRVIPSNKRTSLTDLNYSRKNFLQNELINKNISTINVLGNIMIGLNELYKCTKYKWIKNTLLRFCWTFSSRLILSLSKYYFNSLEKLSLDQSNSIPRNEWIIWKILRFLMLIEQYSNLLIWEINTLSLPYVEWKNTNYTS